MALWVLLCGSAPAWAAEGARLPSSGSAPPTYSSPAATGQLVEFDIPAQPLADALKRHATMTRQPTLFRSEIVAGLTSSAVRGLHSPEAALRLLLDGTGLAAEKVDTGPASAFVLKAINTPQATAPRAELESVADHAPDAGYPGLVQGTVWDALCGDARTAPGPYRSVLRFQVDAAGQVRRARLLGSTGDARRDAAMLEVVQRVRMERPPPPDMPQPVTLLILPREPGVGPRCDAHDNAGA